MSGWICAVLAMAAAGVAQAQGQAAQSDATLVERGRYLATAGDCVGCHTRPGGKPFAGGLAMQTEFGTIYTPNITPDATGISGWTEAQLARAMREGIDNDGNHLYPAFPYNSYTKVTDADIHAIYAYLRSLPPVSYRPPENDMKFPFGIRSLVGLWNMLYFNEGRFAVDPKRSREWNRGAYLVTSLGHCGECHTPRGALGGPRSDLALTGGTYLSEIKDSVEDEVIVPGDGLVRPWSAVNLTSSPTGLGAWSLEDLQAYLKTGHSKRAGAFGPMAEVVGNSTRRLSAQDVRAMAVYLKSLPAQTQLSGKPIPEDQVKAGEIVYTVRCGNCHLPTGLGIERAADADPTKVAPPLAGNAIVQTPDPATLINVILYGAHENPAGEGSWPRMSGFQNAIGLDDEQIAALCNYLRSAWGNRGDLVAPGDVTRQR